MRGGMYVNLTLDIHTYPYINRYMHLRTLSVSHIANQFCPPRQINPSTQISAIWINLLFFFAFLLACILPLPHSPHHPHPRPLSLSSIHQAIQSCVCRSHCSCIPNRISIPHPPVNHSIKPSTLDFPLPPNLPWAG